MQAWSRKFRTTTHPQAQIQKVLAQIQDELVQILQVLVPILEILAQILEVLAQQKRFKIPN